MASLASDRAKFFVALLPPADLQSQVTAIKEDISQRFHSQAALKSPPHITLLPPFDWPLDALDRLQGFLQTFAQAQTPIPIRLSGFKAFPPRVIYIDVVPEASLIACQSLLQQSFRTTFSMTDPRARRLSFTPHMTVGFRDLKPAAFHRAWADYKDRPFNAHFIAHELTLLRHNGQRWSIAATFALGV
ncbi:MAG TPA: 2'-5' RNA ligase family protein [Leptolyngbyaceae cyanobacterium M65_K2018_010]|nr:2'-5' RNA ligase family protein [Leptolyngbyaceae cyanobacterium M65_K2018_010]